MRIKNIDEVLENLHEACDKIDEDMYDMSGEWLHGVEDYLPADTDTMDNLVKIRYGIDLVRKQNPDAIIDFSVSEIWDLSQISEVVVE